MRARILCDGQYNLCGQAVIVANGEAQLADDVIASSVLLMNKAVKNFIDNTGIDLVGFVGYDQFC
jgi:N-acetylglucosamine-6-phosphate deacetylase